MKHKTIQDIGTSSILIQNLNATKQLIPPIMMHLNCNWSLSNVFSLSTLGNGLFEVFLNEESTVMMEWLCSDPCPVKAWPPQSLTPLPHLSPSAPGPLPFKQNHDEWVTNAYSFTTFSGVHYFYWAYCFCSPTLFTPSPSSFSPLDIFVLVLIPTILVSTDPFLSLHLNFSPPYSCSIKFAFITINNLHFFSLSPAQPTIFREPLVSYHHADPFLLSKYTLHILHTLHTQPPKATQFLQSSIYPKKKNPRA